MAGTYPNNSQGSSGGPQQMVGWLDRNFVMGTHITVGAGGVAWRYNRTTGALQTIDLSTVVGNALQLPLFRPSDGHYGLVCGVDRADYFHVVGNNHDGLDSIGPIYHHVVCTNPGAFTNPASWVQGSDPGRPYTTSVDCGVYTYNHFDRLTNGDLLWFLSQSDVRGDSRGRDILGFRATGGDVWTPILTAGGEFAKSEADTPQGTTADRVYVNTILVDPVYDADGTTWLYDLVWYFGVWRTMAEDAEFQQQPFLLYCKSTNLNAWFAADGTALTMPYAWATRAPALCPYANVFTIGPRYGIWTPPGVPTPKPVAVCVGNGNSTIGDPTVYHRLYFNGTAWSELNDQYVNGITPIEMNMPRGQHVYMQNSKGRVNFNGFAGGPALNYAVGPNINNAGGAKFTPLCCPVLKREDKVWLANIGDGDSPRIYTIGAGYPARVTA